MSDLRQRIKLLMEYDSKLTNSENIEKLIKEQSVIGAPSYGVNTNPDTESKPEDDKLKYPNYCKYPKNAIFPPKNSEGASGKDALIDGYCFYSPGVHIPVDAEINFWDVESISRAVDKHLEKFKEDRYEAVNNFTEILPIGSVASFDIGNNHYTTWVDTPKLGSSWKFRGFYLQDGDHHAYPEPVWSETRNDYRKFVDQYGFAVQITAALATAIAGAFTGGAAWVLTAEIALELGLGVAVGLREVEKGENVSAALSFITGVLPMLKLSKLFRGIPESDFIQLSNNLKGAGLTKTSKVADYVNFYDKLPEPQKLIMSKLLKQDDVTKNLLIKELKEAMSNELPDLIIKEFKNIIKKDKTLLKSVKFFERLWVRELGTNGFFIVLGILTNAAFGDILNDEDLEKLKGVYSVVPEELKKEMAFNLMSNAEILPKLANSESFQKIKEFAKLDERGKAWSKWLNTQLKDSIEEIPSGKYTELPDNETKAVENKVGNRRDEKQLRELGFIPTTELTDDQKVYDFTKLNNVGWWKVKK
jgi:hypothetical protein